MSWKGGSGGAMGRRGWVVVSFVLINCVILLWWCYTPFSPTARDIHRSIPKNRLAHARSDVEIIIFGNLPRFCPTVRSAIHTGFKHVTLMGWGEHFPGGKPEILHMKVLMMRNYLATVPPDQVVVFLDSFDSVLYATPDELVRSWHHALQRQNAKGSIVQGTERNLWPEEWIRPEFPADPPTPYAFPNSGVYMGRAGDVLEALTRAAIYEEPDDQLAWQLAHVDNPGLVTLDYHADLVTNMYLSCNDVTLRPYTNADATDTTDGGGEERGGEESAAARRRRPYNRVTDVYPSVLHFNGRSTGECNMEEYLRTAWWDQANTPAARARQQVLEDDFELWSVSRTLYLSRLPFRDICPLP